MQVPTAGDFAAWRRRSGAISLDRPAPASTLDELADRYQILELISRYA